MLPVYIILASRILVFGIFAIAAVVAATHWAVKHGHLTPFGWWPRTVRQLASPFLKTFERRLYRSGGNPGEAPYTFFWIALLGGLAFLAVVQWAVSTIYQFWFSAQGGPRSLLFFLLNGAISLLMICILVRAVASWFGISPYSRPMRVVYGLTDWLIQPLQKIIPPLGVVDITPMVAYFLLYLVRWLVLG